jgi:hypothetical protein
MVASGSCACSGRGVGIPHTYFAEDSSLPPGGRSRLVVFGELP